MVRPNRMKTYSPVNLKLGIKSSLPNPKATLALLFLIWKVSGEPAVLEYSQADNSKIIVSDTLKADLISKLNPLYSSCGVSDDSFITIVNSNQLFNSQLEALIVAFELVWKVAKIYFVNASKPASDERTGGTRYPKKLFFTSNMDLLNSAFTVNEEGFYQVLLKWMGINIQVNLVCENALIKALTALTESAVYKFSENGTDTIFNLENVYESILSQVGQEVNIEDGNNQPKGALRILKNLLAENLNPYLLYQDQKVNGNPQMITALREYAKRVEVFLSLASFSYNVNTVATNEMIIHEVTGEVADGNIADIEVVRITGGKNVLLYGVPGSGKSYAIEKHYHPEEDQMERVVFHPDYTYTDFVGQILPIVLENGNVTYKFSPGPFTRLLIKSWENPGNAYYLIIEEINRGNAPAIFGDVFQLLDRDETTGTSKYGITNKEIADRLPPQAFSGDSHLVRLPSNLFVLATMNTSDQNVFTLDTAFQRRWNMRMIENVFTDETNVPILDTTITWSTFAQAINDKIMNIGYEMGTTSSGDKRLGAYFVIPSTLYFDVKEDAPDATPSEKATAIEHNSQFPEKVLKYLWDDAFKFVRNKIFGTHISLESVIKEFKSKRGNARFDVFDQTQISFAPRVN